MKWEGREESKNVEDRRNERIAGNVIGTGLSGLGFLLLSRGGKRGFLILAIGFVVLYFMGVNPVRLFFGDGAIETKPSSSQVAAPREPTERDKFIRVVLHETEETWTKIFAANNMRYRPPVMVQFSGQINSACGFASAAVGPFYCPNDQKLYLDDSFFDQLQRQFHVKGDFAQAYVIAHEVGHHVQNMLGTLGEVNNLSRRVGKAEANALSVRVELQADCYAGIWAHSTAQQGLLEEGDIESALDAAHKIGDDALQKQSQGYVVPDSFTHGTSEQRAKWFDRGYQSGDVKACDTFSGEL